MNQAKLSKKLYIQWYVLNRCKAIPRTFKELYESMQSEITLPLAARVPNATDKGGEPTHSMPLVKRYIKQLEKENLIINSGDAYSITREGHKVETTLRLDLRERLKVILLAVEKMNNDLIGKRDDRKVITVRESDREFLRGSMTVKNIVRWFCLTVLSPKGTEFSVTQLRELMLSKYGWTCSREYFYQLIRDELGADEDQARAKELGRDVNQALANCVSGRWAGERRNNRNYQVTHKGREWLQTFHRDATEEMKGAVRYITDLINLLD